MKKQQVIFFCGPDRCGKTNIIQELSKRTGIKSFKASSEHSSYLRSKVSADFVNQLCYADPRVWDFVKQMGIDVIFDRGYPCEYAYSQVNKRLTNMGMIEHMDDLWSSLNAKIVFCHRSDYTNTVDNLDPGLKGKKLQKIHNEYLKFLETSKCEVLYLNVDDENLGREVSEVMRFLNA